MRLRFTRAVAVFVSLLFVIVVSVLPSVAKVRKSTHKHGTAVSAHNSPASAHSKKSGRLHKGAKASKATKRPRGQQAIESERAREIQEALIRERYLNGEASGVWDQTTKEALVRYQADNGWQTKIVPDSRALIKLGLGPDQSRVMNPEVLTKPDFARELTPGGASPR